MRQVDFVRALQEAYDLGFESSEEGGNAEHGGTRLKAKAFWQHQKQAAITHLVRKYTVIEGYVAKYEAKHDGA
ncbi:hypothetical protein [Trinickia symbiotica]|uniref:Uncharacterized protein n=1 Tax=Trinickia symbiotica TaxID=863227 RepID=A0A2N7XAF9_9BURK|nr:hypothetical protein [Trinickia symbiotica]PMS38445.1 hypothetical protein C0Z20_00740 [Trinickia symbiotica]